MFDSTLFDSRRSFIVSLMAASALAACGGGETKPTTTPIAAGGGSSQYELAGDFGIGDKAAPVTIVEYASVVCGHCANWHKTVYPELKKKYVDTGKVRFVFRNFPTPPQELADAGHMIALCASPDSYMKNIKLQFDRQEQIFDMAGKGKAREAYVSLAKASGLSEEEFLQCMSNQDIRTQYEAVVQGGIDMGVASTPSFIVNGALTKNAPSGEQFYSLETLEEVILPLLGEPVPEKSDEKAE